MNKRVRGAFSVEAVFLVPFIIFVIMALFYLAFYIYDRAVIQSTLDRMVIREGQQLCHPTDINTGAVRYDMINQRSLFYSINYNKGAENQKIQSYIKKELKNKLSITTISKIEGNMNQGNIEASVRGSINIPFLPAKKYLMDLLHYQVNIKSKVYNPTKFSWIADGILDAVDDTAVYNCVRKYLN